MVRYFMFVIYEDILIVNRFGTVALLLQLVPVLSMFFLLTSAVGSALWVVKLEEQKRLNAADRLVNNAGLPNIGDFDEEAPPPYADDPI